MFSFYEMAKNSVMLEIDEDLDIDMQKNVIRVSNSRLYNIEKFRCNCIIYTFGMQILNYELTLFDGEFEEPNTRICDHNSHFTIQ